MMEEKFGEGLDFTLERDYLYIVDFTKDFFYDL